MARLHDLGWIEGRTIAIEYRWSEGRPQLAAEFAAEIVRLNVDVIVTVGTYVAALKQATSVIPIVFAVAIDPLGAGFVTSLAHPGGNVTGLSVQAADLAGKRLSVIDAGCCVKSAISTSLPLPHWWQLRSPPQRSHRMQTLPPSAAK